jgi:[ribosomal protein S18]-alanine N-acetyltransferase
MTLEPIGAEAAAELAAAHAHSFPAPWSEADFQALLASPGGFGLAIREDEAISAFLIGRAIAGESEVLTLAVAPARRRRGLARALLDAAVAVAEETGAEAMFLEVAADNDAAIGLYEGAGFVRAGARRGYYKGANGAIDAVVMRRDLNSRAG